MQAVQEETARQIYQLRNPCLSSYDVSRAQKKFVADATNPEKVVPMDEEEHVALYEAVDSQVLLGLPAPEAHYEGKVHKFKAVTKAETKISSREDDGVVVFRNASWTDSIRLLHQARARGLTVTVADEETPLTEPDQQSNGKKRAREEDEEPGSST